MNVITTPQTGYSRRRVIRKAAYSAPVVFTIAVAPNAALGVSGPAEVKERKNNNGFGNGPESGPAPGNSGNNNSPNSRGKANNTGR